MYSVYRITNTVNGKVYIGLTQDPRRRWRTHRTCRTGKSLIARVIQKYGVEHFDFEIVLNGLNYEQARQQEMRLVFEHSSDVRGCGYNLTAGGDGTRKTLCLQGHDISDKQVHYRGCDVCRKTDARQRYDVLANKISTDSRFEAEYRARQQLWNADAYARRKARMQTDPEYAEMHRAIQKRSNDNATTKKRTLAAASPEYAAFLKAKNREYNARRSQSATVTFNTLPPDKV